LNTKEKNENKIGNHQSNDELSHEVSVDVKLVVESLMGKETFGSNAVPTKSLLSTKQQRILCNGKPQGCLVIVVLIPGFR
jgi:hypothetical protein